MSEPHVVTEVKQLSSGYWHIRGEGLCNWAQPPHWPCDEETLRQHTFPEACEEFIQACLRLVSGASERWDQTLEELNGIQVFN